MLKLNSFKIKHSESIRRALSVIDGNTFGAVFVVNDAEQVVGAATDGDIRRYFIKNPDAEVSIAACMNTDFIYGHETTPREHLLKMLDQRIKIIPILNGERKLIDVVMKDRFPLKEQRKIIARAKAPVRISFGGGGTDLTQYYMQYGGAVMNASISMFSHALLRKRDDPSVKILSHDLKRTIEAESLQAAYKQADKMPLIMALLKLIKPDYGFELQVGSDFPPGSGLGGSAVVLASIIGCFNQFREDRWDSYEIAETAFQAERLNLDIAGGWQDQYATVFGGFNFMEFNHENNIVHPLRIRPDLLSELEESLLLCYTGRPHPHGIHTDQKNEMKKDEILKLVQRNKELTYKMKNYLLRGKLFDLGKALDEAWQLKRRFSDKITNRELDGIYDVAIANGAIGGKILGAGGGGYYLFYSHPLKRFQLEEALRAHGCTTQRFTFDSSGLQSWTLREDEVLGC